MEGFAAARALRLASALREPDNDVKTERVTRLSTAVALRLGLSGNAASIVELAASVKDVGRLAVADSVLTRRGPLTPQEWEQMRGHVVAAETLLLAMPELRALAPIVRSRIWIEGGIRSAYETRFGGGAISTFLEGHSLSP